MDLSKASWRTRFYTSSSSPLLYLYYTSFLSPCFITSSRLLSFFYPSFYFHSLGSPLMSHFPLTSSPFPPLILPLLLPLLLPLFLLPPQPLRSSHSLLFYTSSFLSFPSFTLLSLLHLLLSFLFLPFFISPLLFPSSLPLFSSPLLFPSSPITVFPLFFLSFPSHLFHPPFPSFLSPYYFSFFFSRYPSPLSSYYFPFYFPFFFISPSPLSHPSFSFFLPLFLLSLPLLPLLLPPLLLLFLTPLFPPSYPSSSSRFPSSPPSSHLQPFYFQHPSLNQSFPLISLYPQPSPPPFPSPSRTPIIPYLPLSNPHSSTIYSP